MSWGREYGSGGGGGVSDHGALTGLGDDDHTQYLPVNGTRGLSADWDAGSHKITAEQLAADIAEPSPPFLVTSTTKVSNLNADMVDGKHGPTGDIVGTTDTQTLSGKTLTTPTIASFVNATHDHGSDAGGGDLAVKLRTKCEIIYVEEPAASDSFPICYIPNDATLIEIFGITNTGTVTLNVERRAKTTPETAGTDVLSSDMVADSDGDSQTSFVSSGDIGPDEWLSLEITTTASSPDRLRVFIKYKVKDNA